MTSAAGILLAAGLSRRYGRDNKLLAPFQGLPLVVHAARALRRLPLGRHVAVCGLDDRVKVLLEAEGYEVVVNPVPEMGMSQSLAAGVRAISGAKVALICLGDMPFVPDSHLAALLSALKAGDVVASENKDGQRSPPVAFASGHFPLLLEMTGDAGARSLIAGATTVRARDGALRDIDTPDDFFEARRGRAGVAAEPMLALDR